jgi:flavodoxin
LKLAAVRLTWMKQKILTENIVMKILSSMINLVLAFTLLLSACSSSELKEVHKIADTTLNGKKVLIVYLSRTNNTKAIAEIIHKNVGGKLVALELEKPYPENYQAIVQQVVDENETGYLPPLKTKIDSVQNYDVVFIGFPTWGMKLPPPIKSFLHQYNLSGKTIVPFNTNAGYGIGTSFQTVKDLSPNCKVLEGFSTKGGVERDSVLFVMEGEKAAKAEKEVIEWLKKIKLIK